MKTQINLTTRNFGQVVVAYITTETGILLLNLDLGNIMEI